MNGIQITQLYAGPFYSYAIQGILGKLWGWGENIDYILGNNDEGEDGKKKDGGTGGIMGIFKRNVDRIINKDSSSSYKKTTYYKPIELRANKELVKISGELQDFSKQLISNINNNPILEISIKSKIKKIACGGNHSLMLTLTGEMFSWGFGEVGQLGLGKDKKVAIKPIRINLEGDRLVSKIYAGYANSMCIIQKTNEVLIWGDGSKGQLCSDKKSSDIPIVIDDLNGRGIYKGTLGYNNAACITKDGKLYVWGSNDTHKLGIDSHNDYEAIPRMIESLSGVVKVSLGFQHSAAILMNEDLYTWGHNFYGQLGLGDTLTRDEPKKVEFNDLKFTKVKCSYSHTLALEKKGLVYVWGKGGVNLSELGKNKNSPDIIEEMKQYKIASIKVGENFSFLLTNNGTLFGFGDNSYYQISATDPIDKPIIRNPKELKLVSNNNNIAIKIIKIFIGYDHCFCITDSGETFAWGNCSSHRLTEDYGTIQLKIPKEVILFKQNNLTTNKKDKLEIGHTSNYSENKQIIDFIKNNYQKEHFQSMKNIFWVLDSLDSKYDDVKLIENDWNLNNVLYEGLNKLSENLPVIDTNQIMHYQKLLRFRFRSIGIFKNYNSQDLRPDIIINNMDEIENIFTLLYLHPCFISAYFESGIAENYFYHFYN